MKEGVMTTRQEIIIGENEVVTIYKYKIALAKVWQDASEGVKKAWISVAEKGVEGSSQDLELQEGEKIELGDMRLIVDKINLFSECSKCIILKMIEKE
ncbi:MAG: hypothetical protein ABIL40_07720 [candidate division WOR-3 bacterium]